MQKVVRTMLGQMMTSAPCERCEGHGTIIQNPCPSCMGHGRVRTTRTVGVTVPAGINVEPRTTWSDFFASMPRRTATSIDSTNLVFEVSFRIFKASSIAYDLPGTTLLAIALKRLPCLAMIRASIIAGAATTQPTRSPGAISFDSVPI